jgi:hypothetical protein
MQKWVAVKAHLNIEFEFISKKHQIYFENQKNYLEFFSDFLQ